MTKGVKGDNVFGCPKDCHHRHTLTPIEVWTGSQGCPFQRTAFAGELSADNGATPHNPLGEPTTSLQPKC